MIEKIISGGQTGADQAALDAAIILGIPHGGWIPRGRMTENGPLPTKYNLMEMSTTSYPERTRKNIRESDGTLILSHGRLTGGSEYTRKMALKYVKPVRHINFYRVTLFDAAVLINDWIVDNDIKVLNVAGSRASEDSKIYQSTLDIIESVLFLCFSENNFTHKAKGRANTGAPSEVPKTVDEAVDRLMDELPFTSKTALSNMPEEDLANLRLTFGIHIRDAFRLDTGNRDLLESCRNVSLDKYLHHSQAPFIIIKALWKHLKETHKLRVVK